MAMKWRLIISVALIVILFANYHYQTNERSNMLVTPMDPVGLILCSDGNTTI
jgi:hypothetical protein